RLEDELTIGDSRIVNLTSDVLRGLGSTYSTRIGFADDSIQAAQELTSRNETSTFATVVVRASDHNKAEELASERRTCVWTPYGFTTGRHHLFCEKICGKGSCRRL